MNIVQRVAKNASAIFLTKVIGGIFNFFFIMYIARYLGAGDFGVLSFAFAFTGLFEVFTDLGLNTLTLREVARERSLVGKYLNNILVIKLILAVVTFGLVALTINLLDYPEQTKMVVYLTAFAVITGAFTKLFYSVFQAHEEMEYQSFGQILSSALLLAGALFVISNKLSVKEMALVYFIISAIILLYTIIVCARRFVKPGMQVDLAFWMPTVRKALPFGITATFVMVYLWIDSVMLSVMKGDEVVGWYGAAYRLVLVLLFFPIAFNSAVFPIMSRFYISSKNSFRFVCERLFKYMSILALPIGVAATILAKRIILLVFGAGYAPSVVIMKILVWAIVFLFTRNAFERFFEAADLQVILAKIFGSCAVLNIILNLILIPRYSYKGAAFATLLSDLAILLLEVIYSVRLGYSIDAGKVANIMAKILTASLVMGAFLIYFKNLNLAVLVPSGAIIYFSVVFFLKGIDAKDRELLARMISGKTKESDFL